MEQSEYPSKKEFQKLQREFSNLKYSLLESLQKIENVESQLDQETKAHHKAQDKVDSLEELLKEETILHERAHLQAETIEILLKETHHRIKNNLALIISLLNQQMDEIHCQKDLALFKDLEHRIYTIAAIHDSLSSVKEGSFLNLKTVIADLVQNLLSSFMYHQDQISLEFDLEDIKIPLKQMIPCSLIVNELLTNALKYAFPNGRKGTLSITGHKHQDIIILTFSDDGVGFPAGFDIQNSSTLGMRIITLLMKQIGGKISLDHSKGASIRIEF